MKGSTEASWWCRTGWDTSWSPKIDASPPRLHQGISSWHLAWLDFHECTAAWAVQYCFTVRQQESYMLEKLLDGDTALDLLFSCLRNWAPMDKSLYVYSEAGERQSGKCMDHFLRCGHALHFSVHPVFRISRFRSYGFIYPDTFILVFTLVKISWVGDMVLWLRHLLQHLEDLSSGLLRKKAKTEESPEAFGTASLIYNHSSDTKENLSQTKRKVKANTQGCHLTTHTVAYKYT